MVLGGDNDTGDESFVCEGIGVGMGECDIEGLTLGEWLRGEERGLGFECKVDESCEGDVGEGTGRRGELGNGG